MVEHRSEKPGVDSSILSLGISFMYRSIGAVFLYIKVVFRFAAAVVVAVAVVVFFRSKKKQLR